MKSDVIKIDIDAVLRSRTGRYYRFIPCFVKKWLKRTVHQDELNDLLERGRGLKGMDFAQYVLNDLNITVNVDGLDNLEDGKRYIFASNHPLGGLDGLALISIVGKHYNGAIRFLVNDLLMAIKPLDNVFMPINKFGRQSRAAAALIDEEYRGDKQMLTFPAGLCSRLQPDGTIADLTWQKHVITRSVSDKRDIVPVYVNAQNSKRFYRLAKWRKRLGIKFNIEMLYLPDELFKKRGETFNIIVGKPIEYTMFDAKHALDQAAQLRSEVYKMQK